LGSFAFFVFVTAESLSLALGWGNAEVAINVRRCDDFEEKRMPHPK
jgi:hypothetical protein